MNQDQQYMQRALELASRGRYTCSPNPMVGCVIVKNNQVIAEGYHVRSGEPHAEINALKQLDFRANGATLYVNLEPCCHHGKTPPCTEDIIQAGISRVVVALTDPNPQVSGKGIKQLQQAGISVDSGILQQSARALNEIFLYYIAQQKPYVIAKWAMSLDGKMVTQTGDDKKISNQQSHALCHELRTEVDAIIVGKNTAINDNPYLTARPDTPINGKQPVRIILSSDSDLPSYLNLFKEQHQYKTIIATTSKITHDAYDKLSPLVSEIIITNDNKGRVCLESLLSALAKRQITSLLVEGGPTVRDAFFDAGLVNETRTFIAPIIIANQPEKKTVYPVQNTMIHHDHYIQCKMSE